MSAIVAIHQPNFAPWLGYFHKMRTADVFVLLDDADFSKNSYTNRVRIKDDRWLTVPVRAGLGTAINEVRTADSALADRHWGVLRAAYGQHPLLDEFIALEREVVGSSELLVDLNLAVLGLLRSKLGIETRLVLASDLGIRDRSTERLVSIVRELGGDTYLSGSGGRAYQDEALFRDAGIAVEYSRYEPAEPTGAGYSALHALLSASDLDLKSGSW